MDDAQFEDLKARVVALEAYVAAQTGQAAPLPSTRSILAQQALEATVTSVPAGPDNAGPYRVYRMNVPALPDDVDPEGEQIWQVVGKGGLRTGFIGNHADADAEVERLNKEAAPQTAVAAIPPGPANPGPYAHRWTLSGLWHVFGINGVHTGFAGSQGDAEAEAKRLNAASPEPVASASPSA